MGSKFIYLFICFLCTGCSALTSYLLKAGPDIVEAGVDAIDGAAEKDPTKKQADYKSAEDEAIKAAKDLL